MSEPMVSRRGLLRLAAGCAALAAFPSEAAEARIAKLIDDAKGLATIGQRIEFISRALRGTTYRGYTLVGGPRLKERFIVRDDAFDCVTFCETVLAAAMTHNVGEFEQTLRIIRYHNGEVTWRERNHYYFEWSRHNIDNNVCRPIVMEGAVDIAKTVDTQEGLDKRRFAMRVIPTGVFFAHKAVLQSGDIIGFVSRRPNLDYFHVGFIAFGNKNELLLRHASRSHHRVLDERMDNFAIVNRVRYVTLLRPQEPAPAVAATKKDG
jgi:hypothetical protein